MYGFSAGGHLVACLTVFWNREDLAELARVECKNVRPDAAIICYPVTSSRVSIGCPSMFESLLQEDALNQEKRDAVAPDLHVHQDVPPCFIWHIVNDRIAPVENSLLFGIALSQFAIPNEMHIFPDGVHGLSLATRSTVKDESFINPDVARWASLAVYWLRKTLDY